MKTFLAVCVVVAAIPVGPSPAWAQSWPDRPDDPVWQAERLRQERERWRTAHELRNLQAETDQLRTESVIRGVQAQRSPAYVSPPGQTYLGPVDPALIDPDPAAARDARQDLEQGLGGLRGWIDQTRPD